MNRTAALALLLALSGCLASSDDGGDEPEVAFDPAWSERALPFGDEHDHADASQHDGLTTPNFEVLGHDPLVSDFYGQNAGAYICGDATQRPDGRRIAAVESRSDVGFALADVTDPADPEWLGELVMQDTYVYDLAVAPDAMHVVLVTRHGTVEGLGNIPPAAAHPVASWTSRCGPPVDLFLPMAEDPVPRPMSLLLVDISDPATPAIVDQHPLLGFGHSAFTTVLDGRTLLLVTTLGPATSVEGNALGLTGFELYELADTPLGVRLVPLSFYRPPPDDAATPASPLTGRNGHDGWLAKHPGTGQSLAYLVGSDLLTILDIADPQAPRVVGTWSEAGPGRAGYSGVLHSVVPMTELRNGRHFTIVGPEWGGHPIDHPSGIVWVLDTTDPAAITEVAAWTLPHEVAWNGTYMFSNHYYGVVDDTLLISMYHGGIWAVDLAPAYAASLQEFALLPSIGAFLPIDLNATPAVEVRWTPNSQEVLPFEDGTMITFDSWSGLWSFRFDASRPAPAPEPWPIEPAHA